MRARALGLDSHQRALPSRLSQLSHCANEPLHPSHAAEAGPAGKLASTAVSAAPLTLQLDARCGPNVAPPQAPHLQRMFDSLAEAFAAERAAGFTIGSHQPPQSAARLDAAVRAAVQAYVAAGHEASRRRLRAVAALR